MSCSMKKGAKTNDEGESEASIDGERKCEERARSHGCGPARGQEWKNNEYAVLSSRGL